MTGTWRAGRGHVAGATLALLAVLATGAGCSADEPTAGRATPGQSPATGGPDPQAPVIMPKRPGESASVLPPGEQLPPESPRYNGADVTYIRMMIPHHEQALAMAVLAPERAADQRLKVLAERIQASQQPEIARMRGWLEARALDPDTDNAHRHADMRGMQTPEAMARLTAARGTEFDRLFVQMMTAHHEGAIEMSTDLLRVGVDIIVEEIATAVAAEQAIEIERLRDLLPA